jgi:deferrochelatase/peroxidase EfeB
MGRLQEGIYHAPKKRPGRFFAIAFLRASAGETAASCAGCLERLWAMWQDLKAGRLQDLPGQTVPHGDLTVLLGMGPKAFRFADVARPLPEGLEPGFLFRSPRPSGGGPLLKAEHQLNYADDVRTNLAAEEFAVQFIADSKLAVDRAIVETWKLLHDRVKPETGAAELELTTFYLGFQRDDHRSWIDFHDGISNLRSDEREKIITIERGETGRDAWLEGGTYLAFLRLEVDLAVWRGVDRATQELIVGRDKLTGCPLIAVDGEITPLPGCPVAGAGIWADEHDSIAEPPDEARSDERLRNSHVHRANQHVRPGTRRTSLRIFRQGYEFMEWKESSPGFRLGLNFVSFQDTTERLIKLLSQPGWLGDVNFGGDPAHQPPGMDRLLRVYASGVYVVPPVTDGERFPGAEVFAGTPAAAGR